MNAKMFQASFKSLLHKIENILQEDFLHLKENEHKKRFTKIAEEQISILFDSSVI